MSIIPPNYLIPRGKAVAALEITTLKLLSGISIAHFIFWIWIHTHMPLNSLGSLLTSLYRERRSWGSRSSVGPLRETRRPKWTAKKKSNIYWNGFCKFVFVIAVGNRHEQQFWHHSGPSSCCNTSYTDWFIGAILVWNFSTKCLWINSSFNLAIQFIPAFPDHIS